MRKISLIALPYDSGQFDVRMGRGPNAIIQAGIAKELSGHDIAIEVTAIRVANRFRTEASALVELQRQAVPVIRDAIFQKMRPILLSGNCGPAALSATAALEPQLTGVIWFDAHGDFNIPETSTSGFLDGMALATLTGDCWTKLAARLESFRPVSKENVIQVGVRDLEGEEAARLEKSAIATVSRENLSELGKAVESLLVRASRVYVHVDLDVLDLSEGRANSYACSGGLSLEQLCRALELISEKTSIAVASITSYDPEADCDGRIARAIPRIVERLAR